VLEMAFKNTFAKTAKNTSKNSKCKRLTEEDKNQIALYSKEGCWISSIARLMKRSKSTIQKTLAETADKISKPTPQENNEEYELDEMSVTIAGKKDIYLIYAINRRTQQVMDFCLGNRTKGNIKKVVDSVLFYSPKTIFTDRLNSYPSLIPSSIHRSGKRLTNRIERKNLTLRNLIKRLSRSTLCFTRNIKMLESCLLIFFWSGI
jgi:IS1 family transposase